MTKYDNLDPKKELEQEITKDLMKALKKHGLNIEHNAPSGQPKDGTSAKNAPAGFPDIIASNAKFHINIEATKRTGASSDSEYASIKDHFDETKNQNNLKKCFLIYVSPKTHYRMISNIRDYNTIHARYSDQKIIPLSFSTFEYLINKLSNSSAKKYPLKKLISVFNEHKKFVDDQRILEVLSKNIFIDDPILRKQIEKANEIKNQESTEKIIASLLDLENKLREKGIAVTGGAIRDTIFLVFCKLYEEKRDESGQENRFTRKGFEEYQDNIGEKNTKKAIHKLFGSIKKDRELTAAKVFGPFDYISDRMDDDFVLNEFIIPFEEYNFRRQKIDAIGAALEALGKLSQKDTKAGQFFTPENIVHFMVKLAELKQKDVILDPACGTARFLIHAMDDMNQKISGTNKKKKGKRIKTKQLLGSEYYANVALLAKLNMYIHGDGKSNIYTKDGLLLFKGKTKFDNKIDVILTNPPLGDLSYIRDDYDDKFKLKRMEIIPKKSKTLEEFTKKTEELEKLKNEDVPKQEKEKKKHLKKIKFRKDSIKELKKQIGTPKEEWIVTGNQRKGGALFIDASRYYLKKTRDSSALSEWRGGKLLIILDEGVLNTADYEDVRNLIRKYFFIKAVISLTRDTFVPISNTDTKTSILYAIKKTNPDSIQKEPTFFAHVERVGLDTKRKTSANHLFNDGNDILSKYLEFEKTVQNSYSRGKFNLSKFKKKKFKEGVIKN